MNFDVSQRSRHESTTDALNHSARPIEAAARLSESQRDSGASRSQSSTLQDKKLLEALGRSKHD